MSTDSVLDVADMMRLAPTSARTSRSSRSPTAPTTWRCPPRPARDTYVAEVLAFLDARLP